MPTPQVQAYAQAIISHVRTAPQLAAWRAFLSSLAQLWHQHHDSLVQWVRLPEIPLEQKASFLEKQLLSHKNEVKHRFIVMLLRDHLWDILGPVEAHLQIMFDDRQNKGALEIASRDPITPEQEAAIKRQFQHHFPGREFYIVLSPLDEPGIVARFRDHVLDLRANSRLRQISYQLLKG